MNFTTNILLVEHTFFTFVTDQTPIAFGVNPQDSKKFANFGAPGPSEIADGTVKYILGSDPSKKFLPSKLENPGKRTHEILFTPTAQTVINVG